MVVADPSEDEQLVPIDLDMMECSAGKGVLVEVIFLFYNERIEGYLEDEVLFAITIVFPTYHIEVLPHHAHFVPAYVFVFVGKVLERLLYPYELCIRRSLQVGLKESDFEWDIDVALSS